MKTHEQHPSSEIMLHSGIMFDPLNPDPDKINIYDIAHALSNICRFTGHTREFYSVAQHSVMVSELVPERLKLAALLHDASEAYICDIATPVKRNIIGYAEHEEMISNAIASAFGFDAELFNHHRIKRADNEALATEIRDLMPVRPGGWPCVACTNPLRATITAMSPRDACASFITAYAFLNWGQ